MAVSTNNRAVTPRIRVLDALDPWGDRTTWMATSPFVPEEERKEYVKVEFLKKVSTLEPVDWLPKVQALRFRLQDAVFESITPPASKERLRAAVPKGAMSAIYKNQEEFNAVVRGSKELEWIENQLKSLPSFTSAIR